MSILLTIIFFSLAISSCALIFILYVFFKYILGDDLNKILEWTDSDDVYDLIKHVSLLFMIPLFNLIIVFFTMYKIIEHCITNFTTFVDKIHKINKEKKKIFLKNY